MHEFLHTQNVTVRAVCEVLVYTVVLVYRIIEVVEGWGGGVGGGGGGRTGFW